MFSITLVIGNSSIPWTLLFKTEESFAVAETAVKNVMDNGGSFRVSDDFGQTVQAGDSIIQGVMFEDLDKSKLAHVAFSLHRSRMQVETQKAAEADPALRQARLMQGPSMISPMGNGGVPFSR